MLTPIIDGAHLHLRSAIAAEPILFHLNQCVCEHGLLRSQTEEHSTAFVIPEVVRDEILKKIQ